MTWLLPIAFAGLVTLAIPIAIHLLVRQRSRRLSFPSLRFLQSTPLAALKRRTLQDWPLLAVRLLILAAAVAALAAPVCTLARARGGVGRTREPRGDSRRRHRQSGDRAAGVVPERDVHER